MTEQVMATVVACRPLNANVWQYQLQPDHMVAYQAGQYLQLHCAEGDYFFSIANPPLAATSYELHVRLTHDHQKSAALQAQLGLQQRMLVSLPFGHCGLGQLDPHKPIVFLAAGTGFAPIHAMIEQCRRQHDPRRVELYWSVHAAEDFYQAAILEEWQQTLPDFYYCPHITQVQHSSLITRLLDRHLGDDIKHWQIVMAGPFDLMYIIRDALVIAGVAKDAIFSDAFEFE